jgi:hypothetical protein
MSNFTVHDIAVSSTSGLTQDDLIRLGINFERLPYTYQAFKAFAVTNNLTLLEVSWADNSSDSLNAATALSIATTSLDAGTVGVAEVTTATIPATAGATQGDYMILNTKSGTSFAVWLDIDGDGTVPSGPLFLATDYSIKVEIVTAGTAIANAALVKAAIELDSNWTGFETITDNGDGTLTITNSDLGIVTTATVHDAAETGAGSITVAETTPGSGDYSYQLTKAGGFGSVVYALDEGSPALVAGLTLSSSGLISGVPSTSGAPDVEFLVTDELLQTATKTLTLTIT